MNYWIIYSVYRGQERPPIMRLYLTPYQAELERSKMYSSIGQRFIVRPATWQERETCMFLPQDGQPPIYEHPVWTEEKFWRLHGGRFAEHYVHVSTADPSTVAFTEDARKGEADRQTLIKPGKYLQKFLGAGTSGKIEHGPLKGGYPIVTKQEIAFYAAWHVAGKRPPSEDTLHFTDSAEEMVRVYRDGPWSCMRGDEKHWKDENHPVQIYYTDPDGLHMAYLNNASQDVIARALCWPSREVFGRVYPTPEDSVKQKDYDELMGRLKALGWKSITENSSVFEGAPLRQMSNTWGTTMMPYLDHDYGVEDAKLPDGSWGYRMTHSTSHQSNTDGTFADDEDSEDDEDRWTCEGCNESFPEYVTSYTVYERWRPIAGHTRGGRAVGDTQYCEHCSDNEGFYCDGSDERYVSSDSVYTADHVTYEANWFEANGGWQSSYSDDYYLPNVSRGTDVPVRLANGDLIHEDEVEEATFRCFWDGQLWPECDQSRAVPGYAFDYDDEEVHPVEMELVVPAPPDDPEDVELWAKAHSDQRPPPAPDPILVEVFGIDYASPAHTIPISVIGDFAIALEL